MPKKDKDKDKDNKTSTDDNDNKTSTDNKDNKTESSNTSIDITNHIVTDTPVSDLSNKKNGRYVDLGESYVNPHNQRYVIKDRHKKKSKVKTVIPFNTVVIS